MNTKERNKAQEDMMFNLFERERWILGEKLGRDPRDNWADLVLLQNRVSQIILEGFGEWMANEILKSPSKYER